MKSKKFIVLIIFSIVLFIGATSCTVFVPVSRGQHKGWFKNPHNPHNPRTIKAFKSNGNYKIKKIKEKKHGKIKKKLEQNTTSVQIINSYSSVRSIQ